MKNSNWMLSMKEVIETLEEAKKHKPEYLRDGLDTAIQVVLDMRNKEEALLNKYLKESV